MTDVVIPLITGFGGVFAGIAFSWARVVFERRQRRRTLVAALISEATNHGISLWRLLHEHPRSEKMADRSVIFYSAVQPYRGAGDVFLAHLPSADVIEPRTIRCLAGAYAELRAAALDATALGELGPMKVPGRVKLALKDRLAGIVGQLREAVSLLEEKR